jgi:pyrophosphatase PpaX
MSEDPRPGRGFGSVEMVLFDLDGTLIDSRELILGSYRHTMEAHLGWVPPDEAWLVNMGKPLIIQLRGFASDESQALSMMETYRRHNARTHDAALRPFPGMDDTLRRLRAAGYRLGVVTSKLGDMALRGLATCGLSLEWFDAFVTADDPVPHKPDPGPVTLALDRASVGNAGRALFVGDAVWDLMAGRAAGTLTAAALWGPFGRDDLEAGEPDYWLARPAEVAELLL